jgi:hypothetical protein
MIFISNNQVSDDFMLRMFFGYDSTNFLTQVLTFPGLVLVWVLNYIFNCEA